MKFWQSLATFGSEWEENRVRVIYRGGKSCHVWPKTCYDFCFVTVKKFETTKNVSRLGKT